MVVTFKEENLMTFRHLFLKDYVDGGMDTYAVYRQADVYDHIEYIIAQVRDIYCLEENSGGIIDILAFVLLLIIRWILPL